ncbi:hypothetical protein [Rhodococcus sp. NPDC056516]|uniref:hypothetical protein n=1 Tax=Rhodococcus sp. NPDC056516 TaxID=3345847 RepID=UPI00366BD0A2
MKTCSVSKRFSLNEFQEYEAWRAVALRHIKRMGTRLGPNGRAIGRVPVDPWFGVLDPL